MMKGIKSGESTEILVNNMQSVKSQSDVGKVSMRSHDVRDGIEVIEWMR
jgi:hypothetical protein